MYRAASNNTTLVFWTWTLIVRICGVAGQHDVATAGIIPPSLAVPCSPMPTLAIILIATAAGSLLSLLLAAILALSARPTWVPVLVSYAIGALLGASLLEVLPEAVEMGGNFDTVAKALLGGILLFFLLEKLVLWRHCHDEVCEAHGSHDHGHDHGTASLLPGHFWWISGWVW
jgi:hypothetical protein